MSALLRLVSPSTNFRVPPFFLLCCSSYMKSTLTALTLFHDTLQSPIRCVPIIEYKLFKLVLS